MKLGMYANAYVMPAPELSLFVIPLSVVVRVYALLSDSLNLSPRRWSRFMRRFCRPASVFLMMPPSCDQSPDTKYCVLSLPPLTDIDVSYANGVLPAASCR